MLLDRQKDAAPQAGKAEKDWQLKPILQETQSPIWWLRHLQCSKARDNAKGARTVR